jgi:hypothetical protein
MVVSHVFPRNKDVIRNFQTLIKHTKQKSRVIAIAATNLTRRHIYEATCNKIQPRMQLITTKEKLLQDILNSIRRSS